MIIKEYGEYYIECDECGRYVSGFGSFDEALDYAKDMDWKVKKVDGEWWVDCDECL